MATRSMIACETADDRILAIYCHHDGYLHHNGKILLNHYDTQEKVDQLMALGDLSLLSKEIGEKQDFDQPTSRDWCLAYGRDRGEVGTEAQTYLSLTEAVGEFDGCDYFYYFDGEGWLYRPDRLGAGWTQLTQENCN
jgi:hypothetical protein